MRSIKYNLLPPISPLEYGEGPRIQGTLVDLILAIPYLMHSDVIPSLAELNVVFRKGIRDAGMSGGCKWKPFEITEEEYKELIEELLTLPDKHYKRAASSP
jgi:hypothetical protein